MSRSSSLAFCWLLVGATLFAASLSPAYGIELFPATAEQVLCNSSLLFKARVLGAMADDCLPTELECHPTGNVILDVLVEEIYGAKSDVNSVAALAAIQDEREQIVFSSAFQSVPDLGGGYVEDHLKALSDEEAVRIFVGRHFIFARHSGRPVGGKLYATIWPVNNEDWVKQVLASSAAAAAGCPAR